MSRALAVVDPVPHRVIGQDVLESLMLGVPVVVAADGYATREHAETGNGGLWYRADDELVGSVRRLLDDEVRRSLGEQGRSYAMSRFGDTDTYVQANRRGPAPLNPGRPYFSRARGLPDLTAGVVEGQVHVVVGVVALEVRAIRPEGLHDVTLGRDPAAGHRLVVHEPDERRHDVAVAGRHQSQSEIDVAAADR